jgi:rhomboid family protein
MGVTRGVVRTPLTLVWLAILFVTTRRQRRAGRRGVRRIQLEYSTNIKRLRREPRRVLLASLLWLDDPSWWPYVPVYVGVVAPAEHRLGWWRWLFVGLSAHVVATYVSQGRLNRSIRKGRAPRRLVNARDVGVSYFVWGIAGVLSGYVDRRWRMPAQTAAVSGLVANAVARRTFTEFGHLTAFGVGLAASPFAPDRDGQPYPTVSRQASA